jgi:hypothetical protein
MVRSLRTYLVGAFAATLLAAGGVVAFAGSAAADSASDSRATFVDAANATTCAQASDAVDGSFGADTQLPVSPDNANHADANVSGVVKTNAGSVQPGTGQELDVTLLADNVVVDAVIVKGGNGYNVYLGPDAVPPALQPDQHYIAPFNGGGNVPAISHWFVCYHVADGPVTGSLSVKKIVDPFVGTGTPVAPIPTSFDMHVTCTDGTDQTVTLVDQQTVTLTGLTAGTTCHVQETTSLPSGTVVTYTPPAAQAGQGGVTITSGQTVAITVENNFASVDVSPEVVTAPAAVAVSPTFTG